MSESWWGVGAVSALAGGGGAEVRVVGLFGAQERQGFGGKAEVEAHHRSPPSKCALCRLQDALRDVVEVGDADCGVVSHFF